VLLVIRNAEGEVRWVEVRDWLKRASDKGRKPVKQIVFTGERFDVMSVRRWRERVLGGKQQPGLGVSCPCCLRRSTSASCAGLTIPRAKRRPAA
jgi:hypothetical protein